MRLYVESSAVLAYLLAEEGGSEILTLLEEAHLIFTSDLTIVECSRTLRRVAESQDLSSNQTEESLEGLGRISATWNVFHLGEGVMDRARGPFEGEPIRTLDALHVAAALEIADNFSNLALLSLDHRVRRVSRLEGLSLLPV